MCLLRAEAVSILQVDFKFMYSCRVGRGANAGRPYSVQKSTDLPMP